MNIKPRELPIETQQLLSTWHDHFKLWWVIHYILGIVGTVLAITVASHPKFLLSFIHLIDILAWISAICIVLITLLMPSRRAKAYVNAWRILNNACIHYRMDDSFTMKELLNAVEEGEKIISESDPS